MKKHATLNYWRLGGLLLLASFYNCTQKTAESSESAAASTPVAYYGPEDFQKVRKFNSHVHVKVEDTSFVQQNIRDNFDILTINVASPSSPPVDQQQETALRLVQAYPEHASYATTFSLEGFHEPGWQQKTLDYLQDSFNKGAIAVKIWKNVGLVLKDKDGKFVMIDDPRFDPILDLIEKNNATLVAHIGEPKNCWLPIEQMTVAGDKNYFKAHPEYHMYLHPEYPSHEQIIAARDRMLQKHPNLRVVGAHLGSLEYSVDELARRLDQYPNLAVDMAERISHFQYQAVSDWQKVHDFFIKYQDRLIYATDEGVNGSKPIAEVNRLAHENWLRHWAFFTSGEELKTPKVEKPFKGLKLPREVVDKIYRKNAEKWFPAIVKEKA